MSESLGFPCLDSPTRLDRVGKVSRRVPAAVKQFPPFYEGQGENAMLVLSRKKGESVVISDGIEIEVVEVRRRRVRLAIRAPKAVPIHRLETVTRYVDVPAADIPVPTPHR